MDAFLHSCRANGWTVTTDDLHADVAVIWSQLWAGRMRGNQHVWQHYRNQNKPVIVLEVGSIKRNITWRVMLNGVHAPLTLHNSQQRADLLGIAAQPWKHNNGAILIALQRTDSNLWSGMPALDQWLHQIVAAIRQHTDRQIVVRAHPRQVVSVSGLEIQRPTPVPGTYDEFDFAHSLSNVYAVVNHNSSSAVQSILQGVPVVSSLSSIAAPVAVADFSQINSLNYCDRQPWINDLAWSEWTVDEIARGIPLQLLNIT